MKDIEATVAISLSFLPYSYFPYRGRAMLFLDRPLSRIRSEPKSVAFRQLRQTGSRGNGGGRNSWRDPELLTLERCFFF